MHKFNTRTATTTISTTTTTNNNNALMLHKAWLSWRQILSEYGINIYSFYHDGLQYITRSVQQMYLPIAWP